MAGVRLQYRRRNPYVHPRASEGPSNDSPQPPHYPANKYQLTKYLYSYNTRSNKVRITKTPGGKLRYLHIKKRGSPPKCGDCGIKLPGVRLPYTYLEQ
jgi:hypothetical protein